LVIPLFLFFLCGGENNMENDTEVYDAMDIDMSPVTHATATTTTIIDSLALPTYLRIDEATLVLVLHPDETQAQSAFLWSAGSQAAMVAGAKSIQPVLLPLPRATITFRVPTGTPMYTLKDRLSGDIYRALKQVSEHELARIETHNFAAATASRMSIGPMTAELSDVIISKGGYPKAGNKWFPFSTYARAASLPGDTPDMPEEDEITLRVTHHIAYCIVMRSLLQASREGSQGLKCFNQYFKIRWPSDYWTTRDFITLYLDQLEISLTTGESQPFKLQLGASLAISPQKTREYVRWDKTQVQELLHLTGAEFTNPEPAAADSQKEENPLTILEPAPVVVEPTQGAWSRVLVTRAPPPEKKKPKKTSSSSDNRQKSKGEQAESRLVKAKGQLSIMAAFARPATTAAKKTSTPGKE
jgi:hypothetical protein